MGASTNTTPCLPPRTAIVIDDQEDVCAMVLAQLDQLGVGATAVTSKGKLLSALEQSHPDFIMLDLALGDTDGVEVLALLGERAYRGSIVLMSGHSDGVIEHSRRIGERAGIAVAGVLRKPFRLGDIRSALEGMGTPNQPRPGTTPTQQPSSGLLKHALEQDWVEFWYQPKITLDTGRVSGAECLLRVRCPEQGIVPPGAFLASAGDEELGALLMASVVDALKNARRAATTHADLEFCINVPGRMIVRPGLLDELRRLREQHEPTCRLTLEITETDVIDDDAAAQEFATRAVLHGFGVSIDDFGTGYAAFDRLRRIPFSELKLDRSVVHGCSRDSMLYSICRATATLAHDFNAKVVAEGVEATADLETIHALGFDLVQGYLFSPAIPFPRLVELMIEDGAALVRTVPAGA